MHASTLFIGQARGKREIVRVVDLVVYKVRVVDLVVHKVPLTLIASLTSVGLLQIAKNPLG